MFTTGSTCTSTCRPRNIIGNCRGREPMNVTRGRLLGALAFLRRGFEPSTCSSVFTTEVMNPFWYDVNAAAAGGSRHVAGGWLTGRMSRRVEVVVSCIGALRLAV